MTGTGIGKNAGALAFESVLTAEWVMGDPIDHNLNLCHLHSGRNGTALPLLDNPMRPLTTPGGLR